MHPSTDKPCSRDAIAALSIELFTAVVPVGGEVIYERRKGEPETQTRHKTKSEAFMLGGHTPCVFLAGVRGCVALHHVRVPRETVDAAIQASNAEGL